MNKTFLFLIAMMICSSISSQELMDSIIYEDIVISDDRIALPFSENSRSMEIIRKVDIENANVSSIAELLTYAGAVDIRHRGVRGVQSDIAIRGGTFNQVVVLINGIKMTDPQTGHHVMNLPLDIDNVERIEILKGPAARIYGQNAFTGVINIITKVSEEFEAMVSIGYGENNSLDAHVGLSLPLGDYKQNISYSRNTSDGYRYNTDYSVNTLYYQSAFTLGNMDLGLLGGYTDHKFGANGFYASPDFVDQYEEVTTGFVGLNGKWVGNNVVITPRLYWRRTHDDYVFLRQDPAVFNNIHTGDAFGGEIHASISSDYGITGVGLEIRNTQLESSNLGQHARTIITAHVEQRFDFLDGQLDMTPGVSFNYYSDADFKAFPGIDIGYRISDNTKIYGNAGYTFRLPTYTNLYYESRAEQGNPDLLPESAFSMEIGTKYSQSGTNLTASFFTRKSNNLIDWAKPNPNDEKWQALNFNELRMSGIDLSSDFDIHLFGADRSAMNVFANYTYIFSDISDTQEVAISRYALDNLKHQLNVGFSLPITEGLILTAKYRRVDRESLEDYGVLDANLAYKIGSASLYFAVDNVTNQEYREIGLVPMPGRWLRGGVRYKFGL